MAGRHGGDCMLCPDDSALSRCPALATVKRNSIRLRPSRTQVGVAPAFSFFHASHPRRCRAHLLFFACFPLQPCTAEIFPQFSFGPAPTTSQFAILLVKTAMDAHSIVVVSLHTPKEKVWGELLAINPSGVTIRGVDLNSFDHFIRQINQPDGERMGLPTIFFPMNRVERISLDEPSGSIPSMNELFARKVGRSLSDYLAQFACTALS